MVDYSENPVNNQEVEARIGDLLLARGWYLALAESCTGGLVGDRITNIPGSSSYFLGGVTAYDYSVKRGVLKVADKTLQKYGAVSEETALEMAAGVRAVLSTEVPNENVVGVSITGIAGPGGGTPEKPVGLVWVGLHAENYQKAVHFIWNGNRIENKEYSAQAALNILLDFLQGWSQYQAVRVKAVRQHSGKYDPKEFILDGNTMTISDTGRRWQDEMGEHILVMVSGKNAYELVHEKQNDKWFVKEIGKPQSFA